MRAEMVGKIFGILTVIGFSRSERRGEHSTKLYWLCLCSCGNTTEASADNLRVGNTRSCGCQRGKHIAPLVAPMDLRSAERTAWRNMWLRCTCPSNVRFSEYGGRGITICERWKDFTAFLEDVGPRPASNLSIDRKDVNGNYEPGNVRWATTVEQRRNRRDYIAAHGAPLCQ